MTKLDSDLIKQVQSFEDALAISEAKFPGMKAEFEALSKIKTQNKSKIIDKFKSIVMLGAEIQYLLQDSTNWDVIDKLPHNIKYDENN